MGTLTVKFSRAKQVRSRAKQARQDCVRRGRMQGADLDHEVLLTCRDVEGDQL
jgi:hypothetical protein